MRKTSTERERSRGLNRKVLRNEPRCGCKLEVFGEIDLVRNDSPDVPHSRKQARIGAGFHPRYSAFVSGCKPVSPS